MTTSLDPLLEALNQLRLYGCAARIDEIRCEPKRSAFPVGL